MYCNYRVLIIDELLQEKFVQLSDSPVFLGPVGIGSRRVAAMQLGRTMALLMAWLMRSRQCPDTGLDTKYIYIYLAWGYLALKAQIPQQEIGK